MLRLHRSFHTALIAMTLSSAVIAPIAVIAADMPMRATTAEQGAELTAAAYLDLKAMLMQLRVRFGATLPDEAEASLAQSVADLGDSVPSAAMLDRLRIDLTSETAYFAINLKYLILAEGAIWPDDKPARTYRLDALSEIDAILAELFAADVIGRDLDALLHRLENVNAWTEGVAEPPSDWFSAGQRQELIARARDMQKPAEAKT